MADKGKKGKQGAAPPPPAAAPPPPAAAPPPKDAKPGDQKEEAPPKIKSVQPKDQVGTRKGCRRYKWEFKDSNREFWVMGHAEVKILSLGCLIAAMVMFTGTTVHPLLTLVITMEVSIFSFFIIIHTFAIQRFMPFILWPITVSAGQRGAPQAGEPSQVLPERGLTSHVSSQTWAQHLWVGGAGAEKSPKKPSLGPEPLTHPMVKPQGLRFPRGSTLLGQRGGVATTFSPQPLCRLPLGRPPKRHPIPRMQRKKKQSSHKSVTSNENYFCKATSKAAPGLQ
ncbi:CKLF like MARVEL transmembrane domain containing 2 [Phyllostomus discolor]|uniref:CKLF like MARVEL transmembrane domain containing 2 n=1 Tax=Phyllostomus discolor TaxID=89673 RepID=A0A833YK16_9CHIR|nr:CKLF like MARVEL transmembrane domain containing 2 [Phyllostomus discolor]